MSLFIQRVWFNFHILAPTDPSSWSAQLKSPGKQRLTNTNEMWHKTSEVWTGRGENGHTWVTRLWLPTHRGSSSIPPFLIQGCTFNQSGVLMCKHLYRCKRNSQILCCIQLDFNAFHFLKKYMHKSKKRWHIQEKKNTLCTSLKEKLKPREMIISHQWSKYYLYTEIVIKKKCNICVILFHSYLL